MRWEKAISILVLIVACFVCWYVYRRDGPESAGLQERMKNGDSSGPWSFKRDGLAMYAVQGRREYMEDRFSILERGDFLGFAIYDGHGGAFYSNYAERHLLPSIFRAVSSTKEGNLNLTKILIDAFLALDKSAMQEGGKEQEYCGSTALVGVIYRRKLYVANAGDCRSVAKLIGSKAALQITVDHKPNYASERARIEAAGGFVAFKGVWRVGGSLAVSRAIGDAFLKRKGWLIVEPDVFIIDLKEVRIEYVILASDGLWDVFSSQEAIDFVDQYVKSEPLMGAKQLVEKALYKGSMDNVCVLIYAFTKH